MSFKPEVIADSSGKWCGNALRFATEKEALENVRDLEFRWFSVKDTRVVECDDPVTHVYDLETRTTRPIAEPVKVWAAGNPEDPE